MKSYLIKRVLQGVLLVVSVSILVFSLLYMMPGNPVDMVVDRKVSAEKRPRSPTRWAMTAPWWSSMWIG